eukprot:CAMPEP_0179256696 /NCGR_PEP_ID=MMETSP0797-20121207/24401_1 /TAXON_ID=47934 /ORGANISM="Dinophysis acuminata, Strain DAEP01" /LENGTH=140 /DNA_ID=CAMNT_0020964641 /DNA_START=175 /DNA_END=597 /DNA_ORIENTATION=-
MHQATPRAPATIVPDQRGSGCGARNSRKTGSDSCPRRGTSQEDEEPPSVGEEALARPGVEGRGGPDQHGGLPPPRRLVRQADRHDVLVVVAHGAVRRALQCLRVVLAARPGPRAAILNGLACRGRGQVVVLLADGVLDVL